MLQFRAMDLLNNDYLMALPQARIAGVLSSIIILVFGIISVVLLYHWMRYGVHKNTVTAVAIIYFTISFVLIYSLLQATLSLGSI